MLPNACPKPDVPYQIERTARKRARTTHSKNVKTIVKARDGRRCRFPGCRLQEQGFVLDAAHIKASGMGGNPDASRMTTQNLLSVCRFHHRGKVSLHSGDIRIEPQTARGADGLVDWYVSDEQRKWKFVGVS